MAAAKIVDPSNSNVPIGGMIWFLRSAPMPLGWLLCDGTILDRDRYPKLWKMLADGNEKKKDTPVRLPVIEGPQIANLIFIIRAGNPSPAVLPSAPPTNEPKTALSSLPMLKAGHSCSITLPLLDWEHKLIIRFPGLQISGSTSTSSASATASTSVSVPTSFRFALQFIDVHSVTVFEILFTSTIPGIQCTAFGPLDSMANCSSQKTITDLQTKKDGKHSLTLEAPDNMLYPPKLIVVVNETYPCELRVPYIVMAARIRAVCTAGEVSIGTPIYDHVVGEAPKNQTWVLDTPLK